MKTIYTKIKIKKYSIRPKPLKKSIILNYGAMFYLFSLKDPFIIK